MPADLDLVKRKVESYLTDLAPNVVIDQTGTYSARSGSARVFVRVLEHPDGESALIYVFAPVVEGARLTPELFEYVATDSSMVFGTLLVVRDTPDQPDGQSAGAATTGTIYVRHTLLGDFLDSAELEYAVGGIASSADDLDDELATRFGGSVFHPEAAG